MKWIFSAFLLLLSSPGIAAVKVVTTTPDLAEVVRAVGGDNVEVQSLLTGKEDPHYAEARPDYILKVNRADVLCSFGLELEVGWLPKVLEKSGNAKIQEGGSGSCLLGKGIKALDIPQTAVNRSMGDVHAHGNPHFNLDPLKLAEASGVVVATLSRVMPEKTSVFQKNQADFQKAMTDLHTRIKSSLKPGKVLEYHKEFTYFFASYGIESLGSLEEKPGMPPSAARIAAVARMAREANVKVLYATPSAAHKTLEKFRELSGIPFVQLPSYVQKSGNNSSISSLQESLSGPLK